LAYLALTLSRYEFMLIMENCTMTACSMSGRRTRALAAILALSAVRCGNGNTGNAHLSIGEMDAGLDATQRDTSGTDDAGHSPMMTMTPTKPAKGMDAGAMTSVPQAPCSPVKTFEPVPPLAAVVSAETAATVQRVFTEDIFRQFKTNCGGCHVDNKLGGFQIPSKDAFVEGMKARQMLVHDRLHSDDPTFYMPPAGTPGSKPWSARQPGDSVYELAGLLDRWFAAGFPVDVLEIPIDTPALTTDGMPYTLTQDIADGLSNLGSCLPAPSIVATEPDAMDKLDALFASLQSFADLPKTLDQTDLVSLNSEILAHSGVISFVPGYPLFSDNARKMRYVRVPHGQSIAFDKTQQQFSIPANTRFYKTFLKKVIDKDGNERYRKIETRLIVSRPDGPAASDGSHTTNSLFASYAWDENETQATLVEDPLRDQTPFRDRLVNYIVDEAKAENVLQTTQATNKLEALRAAGATRNYAIPGRERCIQCHMGSPGASFVLGFTPLQINRRPMGKSGTIEETSDDELSQLQRLIDYKVINGIDSLDDVLPLERSEGDRSPRNDYELTAQAYMVGNCSHCHNPRGYPTVQNPVLRDMLNFLPNPSGGIFQFPLERTSPRIKRGPLQDGNIPYITPSVIDVEPDPSTWSTNGSYVPKYLVLKEGPSSWIYYMDAPWRSLIYRNVESPFAYVEDYALYPHMPMNVPGFDCRVPQIMADWMISIPARLRSPGTSLSDNVDVASGSAGVKEQPYVEVKPDDDAYKQALADATQRLDYYHKGGRDVLSAPFKDPTSFSAGGLTHVNYRYAKYCADTSDIVDPDVRGDHIIPDDSDPSPSFLPSLPKPTMPKISEPLDQFITKKDGIPNRPHWVVTDVTDTAGEWNPRRIDWADVLVKRQLTGLDDRQQSVVAMLQSLVVNDEFSQFATTPQPFGLWQRKPNCDFSKQAPVSSFTGLKRPRWMDYRALKVKSSKAAIATPLKDDDPVYQQSAGAAVFGEICINCHGPKYDSRGRQADNILLMTGGDTRVANLRDGLLGPVDKPGANRQRVFSAGPAPATYDDWAARYVAWMGLGGTQRVIPAAILNLVGTAQVLGEGRPSGYNAAVESANMLSIAQQLCRQVLGESSNAQSTETHAGFDPEIGAIIHNAGGDFPGTALIEQNGDAETWLRVCSYSNSPPVRVIALKEEFGDVTFPLAQWYPAAGYPTNSLIGDDRGNLASGIGSNNLFPWCVRAPASDVEQSAADKYVRDVRGGKVLPFCPSDWLSTATPWVDTDNEAWSLHGAINAGVSVFLYLKQRSENVAKGILPQPNFDQCEQLQP
jgi:mono/diheme cytochrome c family protein